MMQVLGGKKNPRDTWREMGKAFPEVVGKCDNFQFPGERQREIPEARHGLLLLIAARPNLPYY